MSKTNQKKSCEKYINSLELIYLIFLSIGISLLLNYLNFTPFYLLFFVNCILLLPRFFFAPSKNIKFLIDKIIDSSIPEKLKSLNYKIILILDVSIMLFTHAILFILLCYYGGYGFGYSRLLNIELIRMDSSVFAFSLLAAFLLLNSLWLTLICLRLWLIKARIERNYCIWAGNNFIFAILIIIVLLFLVNPVIIYDIKFFDRTTAFYILIFLGILNSVIDLVNTDKTYLFDN